MTPHPQIRSINASVLSKVKCDNSIKISYDFNLFKPPQNVNDYFYYTKVNSEWANQK